MDNCWMAFIDTSEGPFQGHRTILPSQLHTVDALKLFGNLRRLSCICNNLAKSALVSCNDVLTKYFQGFYAGLLRHA